MLICILEVRISHFALVFGTTISALKVLTTADVCIAWKGLSTDILRARYCQWLECVVLSEENTMSPRILADP